MPKVYIATDENGNITAASTTSPDDNNYVENDLIPNYQYEFYLTWEQIDELWRYKVVEGQLIMK